MTVVWIDVPGSTLPTRSEAIDFVVHGSVSIPAISVSFGPSRVEERAFRDGQFLYPYLQSTRVLDTFSLRRTGGWPSDPVVYVDECGAVGDAVIDAVGNPVVDGAGSRVTP